LLHLTSFSPGLQAATQCKAGKDIERGGEKIQKEAQENKKY
jgi:hypothetical protein